MTMSYANSYSNTTESENVLKRYTNDAPAQDTQMYLYWVYQLGKDPRT